MSFAQQKIDIESYLNTNWTTTTIQWTNVKFNQPTKTPWIRCTIVDGEGSQVSLGSTQDHEFVGVINIGIFVPLNGTTALVQSYADTLFNLFVNKQIGSVLTYTPSLNPVGEVEGCYMATLSIPFTRDEIVTIT